MLVFALAAALIVGIQREFTLFYQRGSNLFFGEQAYAYLLGAEELASLALLLDYDADKQAGRARDDLGEVWAREATPYALDEGGWLFGEIEDLQSRFNLNTLAGQVRSEQGEPRYSAAQRQFIRLLQALEQPVLSQAEAIAVTESVADWLDRDSEQSFNGAEDDFYFGQTPAYRAANRAMSSVSELRAVANVSPELYAALLPLVTVWPQAGKPINIHTASLPVLRSINGDDELSPLSVAEGEALIERRATEGFADKSDFLIQPVFADKSMEQMAAQLGESSNYFLLSALVEIADREVRLYSVLERKQRQVTSLVRASGSL
jgi:general secretion pathway protein K